MKKLIVYLIRKRLGLKKNQCFRFANQKHDGVYWFGNTQILKSESFGSNQVITLSNVSLNWLLDRNCKIIPLSNEEAANYV